MNRMSRADRATIASYFNDLENLALSVFGTLMKWAYSSVS